MAQTATRPHHYHAARSIAALSALLGMLVCGLAAVPARAAACPGIVDVGELTAGQLLSGLTVDRGTTPAPFTATVLGVIEDGIAVDLDMIIVETASPALTRAGGVWAGMSGSPVYAADGRLVGAVAYGLSFGPSMIAGLTPAAELRRVQLGQGSAVAGKPAVALPKQLRSLVLAEGLATTRQVGAGMQPLRVPMGVSGLTSARMAASAERLQRAVPGALVYSTGRASAAAATGPLEPGGNVAAALSTGDVTAAGVGTVADVCDTQAVLFGHPMRFDGATLLGAHAADAVYVQPDPAFTPYKVANIGESVGIVDQDRLGGLRATLGPAPSVSQATSTLSGTATGLTRTGTTQIVAQDDLPTIAGLHVLANLDRVADRIGGGTTELDYVVSGTREDGTPWTLQRREHVGHQFDTSFLSFFAALAMLGSLSSAPAEDVAVTSVDVTGTIDATYRMAQLTGVELRSRGSWVPIGNELSLTAGTRVALRATFRQVAGSGPDFTVPLTLQVPAGLSGQRGVLRVAAGGFCDADGNCQPPAEGSSFDDLLAAWSQAPTGDSVTATLVAMTETAEGEEPEEVLLSSATATAPMTVTGSDAAAATIVPPRGPRPAVVSGDRWALRTSLSGGQPWRTFTFGVATDIPVMGDWDGNGTATPGVFRNGTWYLRSSVFTTDRSVVGFGRAGDRPVVGDWDADGDDDLGVYRSGRFLLRGPSGGVAWDVPFGRAGDLPVAGDWDGDGDDTVGTFRAGGTWSLTDELAAGPATYQVRYGTQAGDRPVTGDWDADGATGIGIYRSGTWHLRDAIVGGATSQRFAFGSATGKPVVWR